jgi:hypothetical protein
MKNYFVIATKRSGHHGVMHWVFTPHPSTIVHMNNIQYDDFIQGHIRAVGGQKVTVYPGNDTVQLAFNCEHFNIFQRNLSHLQTNHNILFVICSLKNCLASLIRRGEDSDQMTDNRIRSIISERDSHINYLLTNPTQTFIYYDSWFTNKTYREKIAVELGIPFSDEGLNRVDHGDGSSFDGVKYNGDAQKMDTLNRYKQYESHPLYKELVTSERLELEQKLIT